MATESRFGDDESEQSRCTNNGFVLCIKLSRGRRTGITSGYSLLAERDLVSCGHSDLPQQSSL